MEWTPNLSVGDPEIDNQHQELFQLVSMLDHAITTHSPEELGDIIKFLEHYVETHFKEEEDLMIAHNYEEYDLHKSEHENFKEIVKQLREDYDAKHSNTHVIFKIRQFIDQLTTHIINVDIGIADITKK